MKTKLSKEAMRVLYAILMGKEVRAITDEYSSDVYTEIGYDNEYVVYSYDNGKYTITDLGKREVFNGGYLDTK